MALNIQTSLNTSIGVNIPQSYARVSVNESFTGDYIITNLTIYPNKEAFAGGADPLPVLVNGRLIESGFAAEYTRETNGADILGYAHGLWVAKLAQWGITAQVELD